MPPLSCSLSLSLSMRGFQMLCLTELPPTYGSLRHVLVLATDGRTSSDAPSTRAEFSAFVEN